MVQVRVQGSGFRVQGSGLGVQGSGFSVHGSGYRVQGSGFRVKGWGCRVQGSEFRIQGCGFWVQGSRLGVSSLGFRVQGFEFGCHAPHDGQDTIRLESRSRHCVAWSDVEQIWHMRNRQGQDSGLGPQSRDIQTFQGFLPRSEAKRLRTTTSQKCETEEGSYLRFIDLCITEL